MNGWLLAFLALPTAYAAALVWLVSGPLSGGLPRLAPRSEKERGARRGRPPLNGPPPAFSVLIAARNEAQHLPHLLNCLATQTHPNFEVILGRRPLHRCHGGASGSRNPVSGSTGSTN